MAILNDLIVRGATKCLNTLYTNDLQSGSQTISEDLTVNGHVYIGNTTSNSNAKLSVYGITNSAWYRSTGQDGWFNDTYGGGIYMIDTTYVRTYNNKAFYGVGGLYTGASQQYYLNSSGKLAANEAVITTNLNVGQSITSKYISATDTLRATRYDLQTITQMGTNGTLYVAPSIQFPTSNGGTSVTTTANSITITDTNITSTTLAGIVWSANAKVKISGTINGVVTGTVDGVVTSINTSSKVLTIGSISGGNWSSVVAGTYSASQILNLNIMLYENTGNKPVGILLTSYGAVSEHTDGTAKTYIDIYGGSDTKPVVRLGNMMGLSAINGITPSGWGLYTTNGYFSGLIVSNSGKIGGWSLGETSLSNGTWGSANSAMLSIGEATQKSIGGSAASETGWVFTAGANFGVTQTGKLYCNDVVIDGNITAKSLTIANNATVTGSIPQANVTNLTTDLSNKASTSSLTTEANQRKAKYGTCSTAVGDQVKVVTCSNFELVAGNELTVKFSTANTYASGAVQLNVNSKGAKNVWVANAVTSTSNKLLWGANAYITFRYDGAQFIVIGEPRIWYGASTTAAATAAKTDTTAVTGCVICKGTKVSLAMTNENTAASPTLNIQSTGALAVYAGNSTTRPLASNGLSWSSGYTQEFIFDGVQWRTGDSGSAQRAKALSDNAAKTATNFITTVDSTGMMVHPNGDSTSGWKISSAIELLKNNNSYMKLWIDDNDIPKIRIGKEDQGYIILDNDSVDVRNGDDVLATFGENTRIGTEDGTYLSLSTEGLIGSKNNLQYMQFLANGESQTYGDTTAFVGGYGDSPQYYTHRIPINESINDYITFDFKVHEDSYGYRFVQQLEIKDSEETYTFVDSESRYQVITRFISNSKYMTCYQTLTRLDSQAAKARCTFKYIVTKQKQSPTFTLGTRVGNSNQGLWSCSEGLNNIASGDFSHVEGENNTALGSYAHAEGYNTVASGSYSHAGGDSTISDSYYTFVHGRYLISNNQAQAVFGQYNKRHGRTTYLFILGNGTGDEDEYRSDAFVVDDTGNIFLDIDNSASSGTTDAKLYDAITALGWQNDIINNM